MESFLNNFDKIVNQLLRREKRFFILIGTLSGTASILMLFSDRFAFLLKQSFQINVEKAALLLLLGAAISFALIYLQSGGNQSSNRSTNSDSELKDEISAQSTRIKALEEQAKNYQIDLEKVRPALEFTDNERRAALKEIVKITSESSIKSIFEEQTNKLNNDIQRNLHLDRLSAASAQIVERLRREITDLRLRSNINLLIGMSITAAGLYLLWSTVAIVDSSQLLKTLASEGNDSNNKFLKGLLIPIAPRISLVIFIEIFAYFFLQLYKSGLSEIKYFQNELTNIESKLIAAEFSIISKSHDSLKSALESLSKTERNFILEKDQTTVELEKAKAESELTRNIIKTIPDAFRNLKNHK